MPKKEQKTDSESASEDGEFAVKSYVKADTKKYAPKCDIALSKELQLQYRDEILMEYKESQIVVRKRFDCRGFIHKLLKTYRIFCQNSKSIFPQIRIQRLLRGLSGCRQTHTI